MADLLKVLQSLVEPNLVLGFSDSKCLLPVRSVIPGLLTGQQRLEIKQDTAWSLRKHTDVGRGYEVKANSVE